MEADASAVQVSGGERSALKPDAIRLPPLALCSLVAFGLIALATALQSAPPAQRGLGEAFPLAETQAFPSGAPGPTARPASKEASEDAVSAYRKLPLSFIPNEGQIDETVRFYAQGQGFAFYFTRRKAVLSFTKGERGVALRLTPLAANPNARLEVSDRGSGKVNYLVGSERHPNLPTYRQLTYRELWPGIDMVFRGRRGKLSYEFRLRPGAKVSDIRLSYAGAEDISVSAGGALVIDTPLSTLKDARPQSFQRIDGSRVPVDSRYALAGDSYGFAVGHHDRSRPLVIDPSISYSTYLGGSDSDNGAGIAIDSSGAAYVTGSTVSPNFPTTPGAFDASGNGDRDAFVTKLKPAGTGLAYSTYLGGISRNSGGGNFSGDAGIGLAVDSAGAAYVTGITTSEDFPTTAGAFDTTPHSAFVTKLNPAGSGLVYSTYLGGGTFLDSAQAIAVDSQGAAYVTGSTASRDFPTTVGAFETSPQGNVDAFVTKFNPAGTGLAYSTFLGGSDSDEGTGIAVDSAGAAHVTGSTVSTDFPTTAGAFDTGANGGEDAFVTKLNPTGSGLAYSTFLGGSSNDFGLGFAIDSAGAAFVTGVTISDDFPTTAGAFDTTLDGSAPDGFVTKLNQAGSGLAYSTFLGGSSNDAGFGVAVDSAGAAYVTGETLSTDFPTTASAFDASLGGGRDAFVAKLGPTGTRLAYSTYLGGSSVDDLGQSIAVDSAQMAYVTGTTDSPDFPTTAGAFDTSYNGGDFDAFVTRLNTAAGPGPPATLTLAPKAARNPAGTRHCVAATVRDASGNPTPNISVVFAVSGANNRGPTPRTSDRAGRATFCYIGTRAGTDAIKAFADTNKNGTDDGAREPDDAATKTWTAMLDHFLWYPLKNGSPPFQQRTVTVRDQFRTSEAQVVEPLRLLNPASKDGSAINRPDAHLKCYAIRESRFGGRVVTVQNQFGTRTYQVHQPTRLCNPASKRTPPGTPPAIPAGIDHFRCYGIEAGPLNRAVTVRDQFGHQQVVVAEPEYLCNPASKNGSGILNPARRLVCYELDGVDPFTSRRASLRDQFGVQAFTVERPTKLCVPSR
jgi:Big-like domain-containing protein/beta-propeller repeat-containing protein